MLPNCDCGACCETCGHDPWCIRFDFDGERPNIEADDEGENLP